ncbi:hypothetical protein [Chromobacterium sp. ASV23]|uniref:hypothetical protein n=1 Tax=Chromobacterium sp. ASV23 TaxID=2795110 RepID=UPI0018EA9FFD|nr:hypothetical protein [Chromobacterium sp. ASV23]
MSIERRDFCRFGFGAMLAPMAGSLLTACGDAGAQGPADQTENLMLQRLSQELGGDNATAQALHAMILDACYAWTPPSCPSNTVNSIVALAFGNRVSAAGETTPGPINELLAQSVQQLRARAPYAPVYAQWEIARYLQQKYGMGQVVSIEPEIDENGQVIYLSTEGVIKKAIEFAGGDPGKMGTVGVIGHRDHIKRCVKLARDLKLNAFMPADVELPVAYDSQSGQKWTRRRDLYLGQDMSVQMYMLSQNAIAQAYP